jgi:LPXTG-site transpeptidase (sortase) family protein
LIYGQQSFNNRQGLGLGFYGARSLQRRMFTLAAAGFGLFLVLGIVFFLQMRKTDDLLVVDATEEPVLATIGPARLYIGKMALDVDITEAELIGRDWNLGNVYTDVAHLQGTAYPGEVGNVVLAGHVTLPGDTGAGPFYELELLGEGDELIIEYGGERFRYRVISRMYVDPSNIEVALPTDTARLTLITCAEFDAVTGEYSKRLVVISELIVDQS